MIWTTPNILTFVRILVAPCLPLVFVLFERPQADYLALALFGFAAVTDFFDGWLARHFNQSSELGKMLDPVADKVMVAIALLIIIWDKGSDARWFVNSRAEFLVVFGSTLILAREVLVAGLREYLGHVKIAVTRLAKLKTTAQMFAIAVLLAHVPSLAVINPASLACLSQADCMMTIRADEWLLVQSVHLVGTGLLWIAVVLTLITGWDYFRKGIAYIRERERR